jgi:uncharacterized protein YkwD/uncharacterized membrane protein required for colicin V production
VNVLVDLVIVAVLAFSAYAGMKRGAVLIGFELASFVIASAAALLVYHPVGAAFKSWLALSTAMGNVAGFLVIWGITEIACALIVQLVILPHLHHTTQVSRFNQIGGAILNILKFSVVILLALVVFVGLPVTSGTKQFITSAFIPRILLASSGQLQNWLNTGLGRDLGQSLNFYTVTAEPESEQRIELGFTTTTGTIDSRDEDAMLVLINHERTTRGLKALTLNTKARAVARAYSAKMFALGYFSHIDPDGHSPFDRMAAGGVKFGTAGENLALAPTLQLAHTGLMNSPGHRANILGAHYRTVGIGIIDGGPYGLMVTQDFTD